MELRVVSSGPDLDAVRALFQEYERQVGVDLCFQGFAAELAALPGDYAEPGGVLILASEDQAPWGCVAARRFAPDACEMKRLYVRPAFQGRGLGKRLAAQVVEWAGRGGYSRILLDTLPSMQTAQRLYECLGFRDIEPYRANPVAGARCMSLDLASPGPARV